LSKNDPIKLFYFFAVAKKFKIFVKQRKSSISRFKNVLRNLFKILIFLFVIAVILKIFVCSKHEILLIKDAEPNQQLHFVRYNREFVITVIVITEFDCRIVGINCKNNPMPIILSFKSLTMGHLSTIFGINFLYNPL